MIFAVHYTYTADQAAIRDEHRPAHREWLRAGVDRGDVLSSGAYPDGTGALIIIRAGDQRAAETFMTDDPFAAVGALAGVRIVHWTPVMGAFSELD
ncbi:YciI family protein [Tsukamurella sp. 8F]|uniref:YciI family protein n=1 Tax=unclassified Tsukamurella TaxID=2633480 RepID=UPI0023B98532|nr:MULTISPECIES: YciI family protein [unclassified Tsukamurella]MDF0531451.1 YciI family protein [Tsukamurella sp. 8J]MDF0587486.1 YciI family protein [Tsukamurella sp. 8F]